MAKLKCRWNVWRWDGNLKTFSNRRWSSSVRHSQRRAMRWRGVAPELAQLAPDLGSRLSHWQCDQIGRLIGLWATFQGLWQQLICPNLPHCKAIFVKISNYLIFVVKSFWASFIDIWQLFSRHTDHRFKTLSTAENIFCPARFSSPPNGCSQKRKRNSWPVAVLKPNWEDIKFAFNKNEHQQICKFCFKEF